MDIDALYCVFSRLGGGNMSNTKDEFAWHGSKLCLQLCVNNSRKKEILDSLIGVGELKWFSPLATENFKEYHLVDFAQNHPEIFSSNVNWQRLSKIKAQWDAIGVTDDGTLILVEAKAHVKELESAGINAKNESSTYNEIVDQIYATMGGDDPVWIEQYNQTANRDVYLDQLNAAGIKTILVYIYFVNDITYKNESKETWDSYLTEMHKNHPTPKRLEPFTKHIFYDVWDEKNNNN